MKNLRENLKIRKLLQKTREKANIINENKSLLGYMNYDLLIKSNAFDFIKAKWNLLRNYNILTLYFKEFKVELCFNEDNEMRVSVFKNNRKLSLYFCSVYLTVEKIEDEIYTEELAFYSFYDDNYMRVCEEDKKLLYTLNSYLDILIEQIYLMKDVLDSGFNLENFNSIINNQKMKFYKYNNTNFRCLIRYFENASLFLEDAKKYDTEEFRNSLKYQLNAINAINANKAYGFQFFSNENKIEFRKEFFSEFIKEWEQILQLTFSNGMLIVKYMEVNDLKDFRAFEKIFETFEYFLNKNDKSIH